VNLTTSLAGDIGDQLDSTLFKTEQRGVQRDTPKIACSCLLNASSCVILRIRASFLDHPRTQICSIISGTSPW
jgi:hypothetical protein